MTWMKLGMLAGMGLLLAGCGQSTSDASLVSATSETQTQTTITTTTDESNTTATSEIEIITYDSGALLTAVREQNLAKVQAILASPDYPLDEKDEDGNTPLNVAVHDNQVAIAQTLIDAGADINEQNNIQDSPYLYAGAEGRTEILAYMLAHGEPDQHKVNRFGGNALIPAAEKGHIENVRLLLDDGRADLNFQNDYGYTALIEAVALKDGSQLYQEIATLLLDNGADAAIRDNSGRTAYDYARQRGFSRLQEILTR